MATGVDSAFGQFNGFAGMAAPAVNGSLFSNDPTNPANMDNALHFTWAGNAPVGFFAGGNVGTDLTFYQIVRNGSVNSNPATATPFAGVWNLNVDGVLTYTVVPVPEPGTWAMFAAGLVVVGGIARRRMQA